MRIIKFRVWIFDKGIVPKMVYQSGVYHNGLPILRDFEKYQNIELMQFTGLTDKNGKEIFEGDILQFKYSEESYYRPKGNEFDIIILLENEAVVKFNDGAFYLYGIHEKKWQVMLCDDTLFPMLGKHQKTEKAEIIGNIYENPDLIKNK